MMGAVPGKSMKGESRERDHWVRKHCIRVKKGI